MSFTELVKMETCASFQYRSLEIQSQTPALPSCSPGLEGAEEREAVSRFEGQKGPL